MTTRHKVEWQRARRNSAGSRTWESRCGRYLLHASESCHGIKLPRVWQLWVWGVGGWHKLSRHRKRAAAERATHAHAGRRNANRQREN